MTIESPAGPGGLRPPATEAPRSGAREAPPASLQPPHRGRLRPLDPPLHLVHRQHPAEMGAGDQRVPVQPGGGGERCASTQNQALAPCSSSIKKCWIATSAMAVAVAQAARAAARRPHPRRGPRLLAQLEGTRSSGALLYGGGLRLLDGLRLRVHDVEFERHEILVRDGKGQKDRITMLPGAVKGPLPEHLLQFRELHDRDLAAGRGSAHLPDALDRKYPNAAAQWGWQYVFPAAGLPRDRRVRACVGTT